MNDRLRITSEEHAREQRGGAHSGNDDAAEDQVLQFLRGIVPDFDPSRWPRDAAAVRTKVRSALLKGWSEDVLEGSPQVEWGEVLQGPGYGIRKLRYQALPHYWIPALLYEPSGAAKRSRVAVLNADGHHDCGNAAPYKQARCINLARRGALALSFEFVGMGELAADAEADWWSGASLHHGLAALELTGLGAAGLMFVSMTRALDVLCANPGTDPDRVAMTGLSGGGWQTIVLSALDERIRAVVPVAGYSSMRERVEHTSDVGDLEQVPSDFGTLVDYPDLTAMLSPRPALLILNEFDDVFRTDRTRPEIFDQVRPVYAAGRLDTYSNVDPGTHNFGVDNRAQLYAFLGKHFGEEWPLADLHTTREIRTEVELQVGLPEDQQTVRSIAAARARSLRVERQTRRSTTAPDDLRRELATVIRLPELAAAALPELGSQPWQEAIAVGPWRLPCSWSPGVGRPTLAIADPMGTDAERRDRTPRLTVGILGLRTFSCSFERVLMLQTCGHRLLGLQVAQLVAMAEAIHYKGAAPTLHAHGVESAAVATMAAALKPGLFQHLHLSGSRTVRLDDLIHRPINPTEVPALFCADLLTVTDILDLRPLLGGLKLTEDDRGSYTL